MLPAQQELENTALGCGVVFLHVGGDVAATGKEGALDGPRDDFQPRHTGCWGSVSRRETLGELFLWGPGSRGSRTDLSASLMGLCCA